MATKNETNTGFSSDSSHTEAPLDKTTPPNRYRHKRDSGYGTDVSPSSATGKSIHFTFHSDTGTSEIDLNDEFQSMDLSNDVFSDDDNDYSDEFDEADKEVETLFTDSEEFRDDLFTEISTEAKLVRPAAPVPMSFDHFIEINQTSSSTCESQSSFRGFDRKGLHQENFFRPISRSIGTLSLQSRNTDGPSDVPRQRFKPYSVCKGCSVSRGTDRHQSNTVPLPDIVPVSRDRSVSLPETPSVSQCYEHEVARRLRHISDEFDVATDTKMIPSPFHRTSSFTFSLGFMNWIGRVRKYLSPSLAGSQEQS